VRCGQVFSDLIDDFGRRIRPPWLNDDRCRMLESAEYDARVWLCDLWWAAGSDSREDCVRRFFAPCTYTYDVTANNFDLQLTANEHNVIDLPSDPDANSLLYIAIPMLRATITTP